MDNPSATPIIFQFSPHSSTSTLRKHIENFHEQEYTDICSANGWKNQLPKRAAIAAQAAATTDPNSKSEPFSDEAFLNKIINWIVTDDQVSLKHINCFILIYLFFQISNSVHQSNRGSGIAPIISSTPPRTSWWEYPKTWQTPWCYSPSMEVLLLFFERTTQGLMYFFIQLMLLIFSFRTLLEKLVIHPISGLPKVARHILLLQHTGCARTREETFVSLLH